MIGGQVTRVHCSGITELLRVWAAGDQGAPDRIMELAYPELRNIAQRCLSGERPGHTIQATALVHEAYLRLIDIRPAMARQGALFRSWRQSHAAHSGRLRENPG